MPNAYPMSVPRERLPNRLDDGGDQDLVEVDLAALAQRAPGLDAQEQPAELIDDRVHESAGGGAEVQGDVATVQVDRPVAAQAEGIAEQVELADPCLRALNGEDELGLVEGG